MMIGDDQPLIRNQLSGATSVKDHDGIFHTCLIDAVDVFGGQFKAHFLHLFDVVFLQKQRNPHAFFGRNGKSQMNGNNNE